MPASRPGRPLSEHLADLAAVGSRGPAWVDCYREFRRALPHLSRADADARWQGMIRAARMADRFGDPDTRADAAEDAAFAKGGRLPGGLDVEDYREWIPRDRPGEADYHGYRFDDLAVDLHVAWDETLDARAAAAVAADQRQ